MLSAGMLTDFASATIVRRRGLLSTSPPPARAATVNSLMMRVKTLPRLASAAPFLCLIVCHFEWPDIAETPGNAMKTSPDMLPRVSGPEGSGVRQVRRFDRCGFKGSRVRSRRFASRVQWSGGQLQQATWDTGTHRTIEPVEPAPFEPIEPFERQNRRRQRFLARITHVSAR